jgi:hypothetical protein
VKKFNMRLRLSLALLLLIVSGLTLTLASANTASKSQTHAEAEETIKKATPTVSPTSQLNQQLPVNKLSTCGFNSAKINESNDLGTCTIMVIGDSMASNLGWGLSHVVQKSSKITLILKGKPSSGMANTWFYDWTKELPEMLEKNKPDLLIVYIGANDHQNSKIEGKVESFGNSKWLLGYNNQMQDIEKLANDAGAFVIWVELPVMRLSGYEKGIKAVNKIQESIVTNMEGGTYIRVRNIFADSFGKYRDFAIINGKMQKIRGDDGIHYSSLGQKVLAAYIVDQIEEIFNTEIPKSGAYVITE